MPKSTTTKPRIIFFGSNQASALILQDLLNTKNMTVIGVVTQPNKQQGHTHQRTTPVAQLADSHQVPLLMPTNLKEITNTLKQLHPNLGVLFAYGKILPQETLDIFPKGIINIHPSLLPLHRGPSPLENTILSGDTKAGTSIMLITAKMDAGPILAQSSFSVPANITKSELWHQLLQTSRQLLIPTLQDYLANKIIPQPQNSTQTPSYSKIISKQDGDITPSTISSITLERMVRAYADWPGVRLPIIWRDKATTLTLHQVRPHSSASTNTVRLFCENKRLLLHLSDGCLEILFAQLPNKKIITGHDICNAGGPITLP